MHLLLPIPSLTHTLKEYMTIINPLLTQEAYQQCLQELSYVKNTAKILQHLLTEHHHIHAQTNWLHISWLNAYLKNREILSLSTNFTLPLHLQQESKAHEQFLATFIAALTKLSFLYYNKEYDKLYHWQQKYYGRTLNLSQFDILKGASRIPHTPKDLYHISHDHPSYITLFYRNHLYKINVFDQAPLNTIHVIHDILQNTQCQPYSLSSICFAQRDKAAILRQKYLDHNNFFYILENSLFNLSIFDETFYSHQEKLHFYAFLKPYNTWIHKPLNFIYNLTDQSFCIHCEHTYADASTMLDIIQTTYELMPHIHLPSLKPATYLRIQEYIDESYIQEAKNIQITYKQKMNDRGFKNVFIPFTLHDLQTIHLSKDFFMQLILQYAQYQAFNEIKNTKEAIDMRIYQYGRTECLRTVSKQSLSLIQHMKYSDGSIPYTQLKIAEAEHKRRIKICKQALGAERHLYGLSFMAKKLTHHEYQQAQIFFQSIGYQKLCTHFIATSTIGYHQQLANLLLPPPPAHSGLGIGYSASLDAICFTISYHKTQEDDINIFIQSLHDIVQRFKRFMVHLL